MNRAIYAKSASKKSYDLSQNLKLPYINSKKEQLKKIKAKNFSNYDGHIPSVLSSKKSFEINNLSSTQIDENGNKNQMSYQLSIDDIKALDNNSQGQSVDKTNNFGQDFESKVNKNKQIIRKFKEQKLKELKENPDSQRKNKHIYSPVKDKIANGKIKKQLKSNRVSSSDKKIKKSSARYNSIDMLVINNKIKKSSPVRKSHKIQSPHKQNQSLFDNLQNLLSDPRRNKIVTQVSPRKARDNKSNLEERLKTLQNKLGNVNDKNDLRNPVYLKPLQQDENSNQYGDWRRVDLNAKKVEVLVSNFEAEIEKINNYQRKVQQSLQKYIGNHKDLLESELYKKILQNSKKKL